MSCDVIPTDRATIGTEELRYGAIERNKVVEFFKNLPRTDTDSSSIKIRDRFGRRRLGRVIPKMVTEIKDPPRLSDQWFLHVPKSEIIKIGRSTTRLNCFERAFGDYCPVFLRKQKTLNYETDNYKQFRRHIAYRRMLIQDREWKRRFVYNPTRRDLPWYRRIFHWELEDQVEDIIEFTSYVKPLMPEYRPERPRSGVQRVPKKHFFRRWRNKQWEMAVIREFVQDEMEASMQNPRYVPCTLEPVIDVSMDQNSETCCSSRIGTVHSLGIPTDSQNSAAHYPATPPKKFVPYDKRFHTWYGPMVYDKLYMHNSCCATAVASTDDLSEFGCLDGPHRKHGLCLPPPKSQ